MAKIPSCTVQLRSLQRAATETNWCGWMSSILERIASAFASAFKWVQSLFCGSSAPVTAPSPSRDKAPPIRQRVHFPEGLASGSHNPPEAFRRSPLKRQGEVLASGSGTVLPDQTQISFEYLRSLEPNFGR